MSRLWLIAMAALAPTLVGCAPEYSLEKTTDAHGAVVTEEVVSVVVGKAVGVRPLENSDLLDPETDIELESTRPHIMKIAATGEPTEFVLWGVSAGVADIEVRIDGELEGTIEVEVERRND